MKTELKKLVEESILNIVKSLDDDGDNDTQVFVLVYNKKTVSSAGFGCKACAVEACLCFAKKHEDTAHDIMDKKDMN